jgi:lantibiotic modifying enzyme
VSKQHDAAPGSGRIATGPAAAAVPARQAVSRRRLLQLAATAAAGAPLLAAGTARGAFASAETPDYLGSANAAGMWIRSARVVTHDGLIWLSGPERPDGLDSEHSLYQGGAGVILFLLELARATKDESYREEAAAGVAALSAWLPRKLRVDWGEHGLYTGVAGVGFVLARAAEAGLGEEASAAAQRCRELVLAAATPAGAGIEWSATTDVVAGSAGTGLYLLDLGRRGDTEALATAEKAGRRLLELAIPHAPGRTKWRMDPTFAREMPNFSHGTAGIAFFLARLHAATGRREYLDAAVAGARYLQEIANTSGGGCLVYHNQPDGPDLYYMGWCHGPAGTARLFVELDRADPGGGWLEWALAGARSIAKSGLPEQKTPGFWNNLGQCCGSAGIAGFCLDLAALTGDQSHLAFARRVTADLLARAVATPGGGLKWPHAEHRVRPEYSYAQTGYMQGAAGIGLLLLRMAAREAGEEWTLTLPDSPFGSTRLARPAPGGAPGS